MDELKPKVLVVDDTPANLVAMQVILKKLHTNVVYVGSGNEALQAAVQNDYAVILLDVNMPDMDGFEVAELLNSTEETKNIPIIFVTAVHHDESSLLKGYDSGAVDYVQKPVLSQILLAKVQVFLDLWRLKAGLEHEISARRAAELEVRYLAQHDVLTDLPNRRQIEMELERTIKRAQRHQQQFAVLFLDLDGFKKINDELGHKVGDALLIEISKRFTSQVRPDDMVGRYGGDEFIILLTDITDAIQLKNKLQQLNETARESFTFGDKKISVSTSIGIALYPEHGENADLLISNADTAMYLAKSMGKSAFQFYSESLNLAMKRNLLIEHHLRHALAKNELEVYYQPLIELTTEKPIGAEALLRFNNEELGFIPPDEFIPIAESAGLIDEIGLWVLEQVAQLMAEYPHLQFAVNASSLQFNNSKLQDKIAQLIQQQLIKADKLEIEITEGVLLEHSGPAQEQLHAIHDLGVSLSVDDFGTGYASLSYLKNCPVTTVKIDRSFVSDIPNDHDDMILVKAIIAMAKGLNLAIIAEGVETREQCDFIFKEGGLFAQGYFFSKPLTKTDFIHFLSLHIS